MKQCKYDNECYEKKDADQRDLTEIVLKYQIDWTEREEFTCCVLRDQSL